MLRPQPVHESALKSTVRSGYSVSSKNVVATLHSSNTVSVRVW